MKRVIGGLALLAAMPLLTVAFAASDAAVALDDPLGTPIEIVVLPDSQYYQQSDDVSLVFGAMVDWIVDPGRGDPVTFVSHVGDIVHNANDAAEWDRVDAVWADLENSAIPWGVAPGNHDMAVGGAATLFDARMDAARLSAVSGFGAVHPIESTRASWQTVSSPGHDLLFVHLRHLNSDYGDPAPLYSWLDEVLAAHPDHLTLVTTHEFTTSSGQATYPGLRSVLAEHCTVAMVFSGHRPGEAGHGTFTDACDRTVHHVLTNYQFRDDGGGGFLRRVVIDPRTLSAQLSVWSPVAQTELTGPAERFEVALSPLPPIEGDANCDRSVSVIDALTVAQFAAGLRTGVAGCPLDSTSEVNVASADVNQSDSVNIVDALLIARCAAGLATPWCDAGA